MFGNTVLLLPLGLAPIVFFVVWIFFIKGGEASQRHVLGRFKSGQTEYPAILTDLLSSGCKLRFSPDNEHIIVSIPHYDFDSIDCPDDLRQKIRAYSDTSAMDWLDQAKITNIKRVKIPVRVQLSDRSFKTIEKDFTEAELSVPKEVIENPDYVYAEINDLGRIYITDGGAHKRFNLNFGEREVSRQGDRFSVRIARKQEISGILNARHAPMSQKQITQNIKNRLWNKASVCDVSVDAEYYYATIGFDV